MYDIGNDKAELARIERYAYNTVQSDIIIVSEDASSITAYSSHGAIIVAPTVDNAKELLALVLDARAVRAAEAGR